MSMKAEMNDNRVIFKDPEAQDIIPCKAESGDLATSDASSSSLKSSDGYVPTNEPTSSSSDSDIVFSSDDDDFSSDDVEETIDFIRQKQGILKRAADVLFDNEETYDAANAKATSRMTEPENVPGSIWTQAQKILPQKRGLAAKRANMRRSTAMNRRGEKKTLQPNPRDPKIDLGEVGHVDSGAYDHSESSDEDENDTTDGLPEVAFPQGQWMAQALIRSSSTFVSNKPSNPDDCLWKVISDPLTCSLGLVPPASISMEHGITVEDALGFSEEGRLLTQATPPFCVVYVNKAFMVLAGVTSKESIIGRPVESILQVTQDIMNTPKSNPDNDFINASLLRNHVAPVALEDDNGDEERANCQIMIVPVMDRSRRRRLAPHARKAKRYSCMSHVLIRIRSSGRALSPALDSNKSGSGDLLAVSESDTPKDEDSASSTGSSQESIRSNMVETIG